MNVMYFFSIVITFLNINTEKKKLSGEAETFSETFWYKKYQHPEPTNYLPAATMQIVILLVKNQNEKQQQSTTWAQLTTWMGQQPPTVMQILFLLVKNPKWKNSNNQPLANKEQQLTRGRASDNKPPDN